MRRRGHNHLHVHFGGSVATVGMLPSIAWEFPYSIMIHGPDEFYDVNQSYLRRKVERAQFVLCISDYCRSQVMKICDPVHWNKLHVLRLGVDPNVFFPDRSHRGRSVVEIVCVGRLVSTKGQLVLLRAVAELLRRGYPLRLRLIGEGADRGRLEAFILERQLGDSIFLEGARNHEATRKLLGQADIFALASFAEGLPVALMEAMAMEIACVSTYVGAIPELIRDGQDGLLVPPSSHEGLVMALEQLILDVELRQRLAASGHRRVLEFYNLERNVHALAAALEGQLPLMIS
jgi:colanic acid/amylovoran biosynthesis glycosyltransferase